MRTNGIIFFILLIQSSYQLSRHPKLLIISFDGFRHDLLDKDLVPNIYKWATLSTWFTSGVQSQFLSNTAPNHMSIATGLYEENHGIVGNYFFDPETKKVYDYFNMTGKPGVINASQAEFWYNADPIWLTNERWESSRRSAALYWPNGDSPFPYIPHKPIRSKPWKTVGSLETWMKDADEVIDMFTRLKEPFNFVAWYIAEPDHVLHENGFHNGELRKKLTELDKLFRYFIEKFDDNNLGSEVNIILTADHGHAEIIDESHVMCVNDYVNKAGFEIGDRMIYPHSEEIARELYDNLTQAVKTNDFDVSVHWKNDTPERWHYKNNSKIGSIIFEPKLGSAVSFSCNGRKMKELYGQNGTKKFNSSIHGLDPELSEMRAFLVMRGPAFSENFTIADIPKNIDLYPLMCRVLNITATPNNGSMEIVQRALKVNRFLPITHSFTFNAVRDSMSFSFILFPSMCIVILFFIYGCRNTVLKTDPTWGRSDNSQGYRPLNPNQNNGFEGDADFDVEVGRSNRQLGSNGRTDFGGPISMSGLLDELSDDEI